QTTYIAGTTRTFPTWLKLSRSGSTFTGSVSADGTTWTIVGTVAVSAMSANATAGLAVTSHNTSIRTTVVFDNVSTSATVAPSTTTITPTITTTTTPPPTTTTSTTSTTSTTTTTAPPAPSNIVIYASDIPSANFHG